MLDTSKIGTKSPPVSVPVEIGQLKFFAKATGETNLVYTDETAAREAGYRSLPAPPTFAFSLSNARPDPFKRYTDLGLDLGKILHGQQQFDYVQPICAGDVITIEETLSDAYEKKGGALQFYIFDAVATNQHGDIVLRMKNTVVQKHG